jgi:hypothetical protein
MVTASVGAAYGPHCEPTVRVRVVDAIAGVSALSVTVTVIEADPTSVAVPDSTPPALMDVPAGVPVALQVYGCTPPLAVNTIV